MISITCWRVKGWAVGKALAGALARMAVTTLLVGLAGAALVRLGPGFDFDERLMDTRLAAGTKAAIRAEAETRGTIGMFYVRYVGGMLRGDLGVSRTLNQPVAALIGQRLPVTLGSLGFGIAGGLALGFLLAAATLLWRTPAWSAGASFASALCLAFPSAAIALVFLWAGANGRWAIALVVFPHVYRYSKNLLAQAYRSPHVLTALAKGLGKGRVLWAHVLAPAGPQLAALAGISVSMAFGASIPIEVICDSPGIGQLAWQAASGRDLPLLVGITMLVSVMTLGVNSLADLTLAARIEE